MGDVRDDCGCLDDEGFLPHAGGCVWGFAKVAADLRCCACGGTPTGLPDAADMCANHTLCDVTRTLLPSPTATLALAATLEPASPAPPQQQTPQPPPQGATGGGGGGDDDSSAVPALVAVIVVLVLLLLCCAVAAAVLRRRAARGGRGGGRDDRAGGAKADDSVELLGGEENCEKPAPAGGSGGSAGYGLIDVDDDAAADGVARALENEYAWLTVGESRGGAGGVGRPGPPLATLRTRVDECVTSAIRSLKVLLRTDFVEVEAERGVVRLPAPPFPALRTTARMRAAAAQRRVAPQPPAPPPVSLFEPSPADSSTGELTSALRGGPPPMAAPAAATASMLTSGRPKRRVYISSESERGGGGRGITSPAFGPTESGPGGGGGFLSSDDGGGGGGGGIGGGMPAAPTRPFDPLIDSLRSRGAWSVTSSTATAGGTVRSCLNISIPWQIRQSPHNERTHPLSRQKGELDPYESAQGDVLDEMLENLNFPEASGGGGGGKGKSATPAPPSPLSVLAVLSRHLARDFAALPHLCAPYPPSVLLCLFLYVAPASVLDECLGWPDAGQPGVRHNKPVFLQWQFWPKLVTLLSSYALREGRRRDVPLVLSGDMQGSHPYAPGDCVCLPGLTLCSTAGEEAVRSSSFSAIASSYLRIPYSDLALLPPLTCLVVEDVVAGERGGRHVEATVVPLGFSELMEESLRTVEGVDKRLQAEVAEMERLSVGLTKVEPRRGGAYGGGGRGGDRLEQSEVDTGRFLSG